PTAPTPRQGGDLPGTLSRRGSSSPSSTACRARGRLLARRRVVAGRQSWWCRTTNRPTRWPSDAGRRLRVLAAEARRCSLVVADDPTTRRPDDPTTRRPDGDPSRRAGSPSFSLALDPVIASRSRVRVVGVAGVGYVDQSSW